MKISKALAVLVVFVLLGSAVFAQTPVGQTPVPATIASATAAPSSRESAADSASQLQSMQKMNVMSGSVTKMSDMCQMMMKREILAMPYKMAAGITIGVLLFVALVLLVILEVQWIIYWSRLLKTQTRNRG